MLTFETKTFVLTVGDDCCAESLVVKRGQRECLTGERLPLFTVTQPRPFNNETKLAHPNKRYTYPADRVRREGSLLTVGFDTAPYEAVIEVCEKDGYISFTLRDFIVHPDDYPGLTMTPPPVSEFRILQLPLIERGNYGEWLNVLSDNKTAVNIEAVSPYLRVDSELRNGTRTMYADALADVKLKDTTAVLIACPTDELSICIDSVEKDYDLPRGVESRSSGIINRSIFWTAEITPDNADRIISYAAAGGFSYMLIYYTAIFKEAYGYGLCGNYDYRDEYPEGRESLEKMLDKIKAHGITPGFHFLQTHIGLHSRYVTPSVDPRLGLKKRFTLKRPLNETDDTVYVLQNPEGSEMCEHARLLTFGGELISYTAYDTETRAFTGCVRGVNGTEIKKHPYGEAGGILDVSEFGASSCYIDQETDLQDEIAEKIADAYNAGFGFCYFDGSEGTNAPYEIYVPAAQYKVWKRFRPAPLFTEGAAKAHFSWHYLSGGNAFDVFPADVFKEKIDEYPAAEAPHLQHDFTQLNFGWWNLNSSYQPDMYEYGTSHAAGWNCPVTIQFSLSSLKSHPHTNDILDVMRRWEEMRINNLITEQMAESLRVPGREHHLLINEYGEYELVVCSRTIETDKIRAQVFTRDNETYALIRNPGDKTEITLNLPAESFSAKHEICGAEAAYRVTENGITLTLNDSIYIKAGVTEERMAEELKNV